MSFPWEKVDKNSDNGCWEIETANTARYGRVNVGEGWELAHRVVYRIKVGDTGDKLVLHECDNPACVNPDHLFLGTQADNMKDMYDKGRREPIKGEDNPGSKLTEEQVIEIRQRCEDGETYIELAEAYSCARTTIGAIVREEIWTHI